MLVRNVRRKYRNTQKRSDKKSYKIIEICTRELVRYVIGNYRNAQRTPDKKHYRKIWKCAQQCEKEMIYENIEIHTRELL